MSALLAFASAEAASRNDIVQVEDASGSRLAKQSLSKCFESNFASSEAERIQLLEGGLADAEQAVAKAEQDPKAHFAVFCNLGRKMQAEGASFSAVSRLARLKREIDRTLDLAPSFVDALAAKGALLIELPGWMGGDEQEGEKLIRRGVELAPDHPRARLELAKVLAEKGDDDAALEEAHQVVALAQSHRNPAALREARELADALGS